MRLVQRHLDHARHDLHRAGEASERREEDGEAVRPERRNRVATFSRTAGGGAASDSMTRTARSEASRCCKLVEERLPPRERARRTGAEREEFLRSVMAQRPAGILAGEARGDRLRAAHRPHATASAAMPPTETRLIAPSPPMQTRAILSPASMPPGCSAPQSMIVSPSRSPASRRCEARPPRSTMRSARCPPRALRLKPPISRRPRRRRRPCRAPRPAARASAAGRGLGDDGAKRRAGAKRGPGRLAVGGPVRPVELRHAWHIAAGIDDARRGRAGEDRRLRDGRLPAAGLDMQREKASPGRAGKYRALRPAAD